MQWKQMDIASVASIAHIIWIRDPECSILFCFSVYFSVVFSWRFDVVVFPISFPYYRFEHIKWTFRRSSPGTLGRDSLPASAWNGEEAWSIRVSGCDKCVKSDFAFPNKGLKKIVTWTVDVESRTRYLVYDRKVVMEKILWAPVHRVQTPMHELPKCLTIGFNVQVMSALMPIVLLKVRKPPKNKQIMDVKVSSGKKKHGGRWENLFRSHFLLQNSPHLYIYIYIWKNLVRKWWSGKTHHNHLIKLRHLCLIPGDNFRLVRRSWASAPAF